MIVPLSLSLSLSLVLCFLYIHQLSVKLLSCFVLFVFFKNHCLRAIQLYHVLSWLSCSLYLDVNFAQCKNTVRYIRYMFLSICKVVIILKEPGRRSIGSKISTIIKILWPVVYACHVYTGVSGFTLFSVSHLQLL